MTLASQYCCLEGCPGAAVGTTLLCDEHNRMVNREGGIYLLDAEQQLRLHERREALKRAGRKDHPR